MATGHIRKRETKHGISYQVIVEGERDPITGRRERHYKTVNGTKKQSEAVMRKLIDEVENGGITTPSVTKLSTWMEEWISLYLPNLAQSTKDNYEERINNRINPYLGEIPLKSLNTAIIQSWINSLNKELSPKSVRNIFHNLNAALKQAVKLRMIPYNPCDGTVLPKLQKYNARTYTVQETNKILRQAAGTDVYLPLLLDFSTGLRLGELMALTWDDIDFQNGKISVNKSMYAGKGKRQIKVPKTISGIRSIDIGEKVLAVLKEEYTKHLHKKSCPEIIYKNYDNYVICNDNGIQYHPDTISKKCKKFIKNLGIKEGRFHDVRHSNATAMVESGVDIKTVQTRLGHSTISTTMNFYVHCTEKMGKKAADTIDNIIF